MMYREAGKGITDGLHVSSEPRHDFLHSRACVPTGSKAVVNRK